MTIASCRMKNHPSGLAGDSLCGSKSSHFLNLDVIDAFENLQEVFYSQVREPYSPWRFFRIMARKLHGVRPSNLQRRLSGVLNLEAFDLVLQRPNLRIEITGLVA
jgi:hypothetical protein